MSQKIALSSHRDIPILLFLWEWKLISTAALARKFFKDRADGTAYNRLNDLKLGGLVESRSDERGQHFLWSLTKKGYHTIRDLLPALKEDGYKSEHVYHDFLVSAVHLGDWLLERPKSLTVFTEQQLRRYDFEFYPAWVPQSLEHRPDGYWHMSEASQTQTVALEVELTRKKSSDYRNVGEFYSDQPKITKVLWIVPSETTAKRIQSQFDKLQTPRSKIHNFVRLKDFFENGYDAEISLGPDHSKTIRSFFLCNDRAKPGNPRCRCTAFALLDTRKRTFLSATSECDPIAPKPRLATV